MIKTLHLTNCWHERSGGIATFYRALIEEANKQGRQIRLVVPGETDRVETAGDFGKIYYLAAPPAPFNSHYRVVYPSQFLSSKSKLQRILIEERPDLVEICDKYALNYLGALLRRRLLPAVDFRPVVVGLSCERMDDNVRSYIGRFPFAQPLSSTYMKWIYFPFFDHHIANSAYTAQELQEVSRGHITSRNTWVRPMGVDLNHLSPSRKSEQKRHDIRASCRAERTSRLLFYAGRLAPEKNLKLLFDAFVLSRKQSNADYRLLIAGDGIERAKWEGFCRTHAPGLVTFLGHVQDPERLADLFANCDAFVHPNPREPFGIAPLQAMASGLPLVAPDCGGITTYANSLNAWLAPPDAPSFTAVIEHLFADEELRANRRRSALETAVAFRWEKVAPSFFDLYTELCALQRAGENSSGTLPKPDFSSSHAVGWRLSLSRSVSHAAETMFQFAAARFDRPQPAASRK